MHNHHTVIDLSAKGDLLANHPVAAELFDAAINAYIEGGLSPDSRNKLIKYISMVYDPGSQYIQKYPDIRTRKEHIQGSLKIYNGTIPPQCIIIFLRYIFKNSDWTLICANENTFEEFAERVNTPIAKEDLDDANKLLQAVERKSKLLDVMQTINERLKSLKKNFYNDDSDIADTELPSYLDPEAIAKKMNKKNV